MQLEEKTLRVDGEQLVCEFALRERNAVILHGAGKANRKRMYNLAQALLERGVGVVLFDFSGHGDSSGDLSELSLSRRQMQAQEVIDSLLPDDSSLYLIGFSMGGQTLCDILPRYLERTLGILLCCPAMYSESARDLKFGNPEFTAILRTPGNWNESTAPAHLEAYSEPTIIAMGTEDKVIPPEVVELYKRSAQQLIYKEYPGVDHKLSAWFADNPVAASEIILKLTVAA